MRSLGRLLLATSLMAAAACAHRDWIDRTLVTESVAGVWSGTAGGRAVLQMDLLDTFLSEISPAKWRCDDCRGAKR